MAKLVFVDCEATGPCPGIRVLTEFGAVDYGTRRTFHGVLHDSEPDPANPAQPVLTGRAYDAAEVFGASGLGSTAWAKAPGLRQPQPGVRLPVDQLRLLACHRGEPVRPLRAAASATTTPGWSATSAGPRTGSGSVSTPHDHNPVNDAMGNAEAFETIQRLHHEGRLR
jgi:hypothetical protein